METIEITLADGSKAHIEERIYDLLQNLERQIVDRDGHIVRLNEGLRTAVPKARFDRLDKTLADTAVEIETVTRRHQKLSARQNIIEKRISALEAVARSELESLKADRDALLTAVRELMTFRLALTGTFGHGFTCGTSAGECDCGYAEMVEILAELVEEGEEEVAQQDE